MSPFRTKEREFPPGHWKVLDEPPVYLDVQSETQAELEFQVPDVEIHVREPKKQENIVRPRIPIKGRDGTEVVLYDFSAEEILNLTWEPSEEEKGRRIRARVDVQIDQMKFNDRFPLGMKLLLKKADELGQGKFHQRLAVSGLAIGGLCSMLFLESWTIFPIRAWRDWRTDKYGKMREEMLRQAFEEEQLSS